MTTQQRKGRVALGGADHDIHQLTDREHVRLDQWVQASMIDAARRSVPDDQVGTKTWDRTVQAAVRASVEVSWTRSGMMKSTEGFGMVVATSLGVSLDEALALVSRSSDRELVAFNDEFLRVNYPDREARPGANPPQPAG